MSEFESIDQFFGKDIWGVFYFILKFVQSLKIPFIIISLLLLAGILYFAVFTNYLYYRYFESWEEYANWKAIHQRGSKKKKTEKTKIKSMLINGEREEKIITRKPIDSLKPLGEWERIFEKAESPKDIDCRLALVDADRLLNKKLEESGVSGRNIDEKIKQISDGRNFSLEDIRALNKSRDLLKEIFINEKRRVSQTGVKDAIAAYKKIFDNILN